MDVAKGTAPCFLKGLEDIGYLSPFYCLVIVESYWKIVATEKKSKTRGRIGRRGGRGKGGQGIKINEQIK